MVLEYLLQKPDFTVRKREGRNTAAGALRLQLGIPRDFFPLYSDAAEEQETQD